MPDNTKLPELMVVSETKTEVLSVTRGVEGRSHRPGNTTEIAEGKGGVGINRVGRCEEGWCGVK